MDRDMEDAGAVAAMVAGNPAGLETVYRRYADRLYAYARSIVGDGDTAADVVQETFLLAQERVGQLRDPSRLASWLYTIARNECLARLRARKRTVMLAESHEPVLDTDPGRAVHAEQVRELVHAAAAGMNDGDREVFELTVRHGLSAAEVARVLDVSDKHAHARISRARSQFEGALGALVLARDGRGRCEQLDGIVADWGGQLTALLRKRIERHARDCVVCMARRQERMNPAGLLASYATLPFLAVASQLWPALRPRLGLTSSDAAGAASPELTGGAQAPTTPGAEPPTVPIHAGGPPTVPIQAGPPTLPIQAGGAPPPVPIQAGGAPTPRSPSRSVKGLVIGAAAAIILIIVGAAAVRLLTLQGPTTPVAGATDTSPAASASSTTTPAPPTTAPPTTPPPPTQTSTPPPAAFTLSASGQLCAGPSNELRVEASASLTLTQARVFYQQPPGTATRDRAMAVSGSTATVAFSDWTFAPEVLWWVQGRASDGRTRETAPVTTFFAPC